MQNVERWPQSILTSANTRKRNKYHAFLAAAGAGARLLPIALSTLGGWHEEARAYFDEVCAHIASNSQCPRHYTTAIIFGRVAARLVLLNARSLTEGVTILP